MSAKTILVVEDERMIAEDIIESLSDLGYRVPCTVASGREALQKTQEYKPDLILMDIMLKGEWDGIQTAEEIHKVHDCALIYLTAFTDQAVLQRAKITSPFGYILKPFREKELHAMVEISLYRHEQERQSRERQQLILNTLSHSQEAIVVIDEQGLIHFLNQQAAFLTGLSPRQALKQPIQEILHFSATHEGELLSLLGPCSNQTVFLQTAGEPRPMRISITRINDGIQQQGLMLTLMPLNPELWAPEQQGKTQDLIPVCASCKNIRSPQGLYQAMEQFFREHFDFQFSHGICPTCFENLYPEYFHDHA